MLKVDPKLLESLIKKARSFLGMRRSGTVGFAKVIKQIIDLYSISGIKFSPGNIWKDYFSNEISYGTFRISVRLAKNDKLLEDYEAKKISINSLVTSNPYHYKYTFKAYAVDFDGLKKVIEYVRNQAFKKLGYLDRKRLAKLLIGSADQLSSISTKSLAS